MSFLRFYDSVFWIAVLAIVGSFFLPWVRVQADLLQPLSRAEQAGWGSVFGNIRQQIEQEIRATEESTGQKIITQRKFQASGFEIPRLVNTKNSRLALSFVELISDKAEGAKWKCYGVYVVPGLALLLGILYQFVRSPHWGPLRKFPLLVCLVAAAFFLGALYKIHQTRLDHVVLQTQIAFGLWISLIGYALLSVSAFLGTLALCFVRTKR